ncbi:hypothetical protein DRW03_15815 [Corallococcus sp. H22C18031201]|nr:hypothetical protein DRW03_15815 [Corallococcus sp. H22C18031201]
METARIAEPFRGDILLDLNGEEWKAQCWGHAQLLLREHIDMHRVRTVFPVVSWGDIGAASGVAALCLATRSFVRRASSADRALICCLSDDGGAGALLLERIPAAGQTATRR